MRVLWLCNMMMPVIAEGLGLEASNKEGWLSGLADVVLSRQGENQIELTVAFPAPAGLLTEESDVCAYAIATKYGEMKCYAFREDVSNPHIYDEGLEGRMGKILQACEPDVIHCFGTEYPHTLAMCRVAPEKDRLLLGIQGLCSVIANAYLANLPERVVHSVTFRDLLKKDSVVRQQQKFVLRGAMEKEAIGLTGNVTGRTAWDRFYTGKWNPKARYYQMNETLRPDFYGISWDRGNCVPRSIFVSQGDLPLKGFHYLLKALPAVISRYPDVHVWVAGDPITGYQTWKQKLKISAYGKYLRRLLSENGLGGYVTFLGRLSSTQMKEQYLKSHLYVCCSSIENSPNSLGEAMLLGMPCVSADVGGIASIFTGGEDGILYQGFRSPLDPLDDAEDESGNGAGNVCGSVYRDNGDGKHTPEKKEGDPLESISQRLAGAIIEMWSDEEKLAQYCENARRHAGKTHDREQNYGKLVEIYSDIVERASNG